MFFYWMERSTPKHCTLFEAMSLLFGINTSLGSEKQPSYHAGAYCPLILPYSHWPELRPGQGSGTNGLYDTVWTLSHITPEPGWGPRRIVPHCSGPSPCPGSGSAQCEYTISPLGHLPFWSALTRKINLRL